MVHSIKNKQLTQLIEEKRNEMLMCAQKHGHDSEQTLRCSQELDKLIIAFQQKLK